MKMWEEEETEKKSVHERLQKVYNFMINFYGEEIINEIILFYQNFRFNDMVRDFSDEKINME
jgi:hypothetical protein